MRTQRFLLAIFLFPGLASAFADASPAHVVESFYERVIYPTPGDSSKALDSVRPLMGDALFEALEAQRMYEAACARLVPADIKPYMLDQSPFFLWPDGATSLVSAEVAIRGHTAHVSAQLAYDDLNWTDTVILRHEEGRWIIVDIKWQEGSLTQRLVDFASHRCTF